MSFMKNQIIIVALCLAVASVHSAPTESETQTTPMTPSETPSTTTTTTSATTEALSSTTPMATSEASYPSSTSAPTSESMAVSSAQDMTAHLGNTSFTCYNKKVGYYADPDAQCKVYHFCMLGDYNGQEVYQRISYLCLNDTIFDQQALDCVEASKISAPCVESAKYYDESNTILRKAIIGQPASETSTASSS